MSKIFITKRIPEEVKDYISKYCEFEAWENEKVIPREELYKKLHDKDGLLTVGVTVDKELLDHAPKLKVVSTISVGYNNFDLNEMKARKVSGTNTPGVLDDAVADLVFGLILSAARRIPELDVYVKNGLWKSEDEVNLFGLDVHHATVGIIGMGRIGEVVAKRAKLGFDMDVLYYNRNRKHKVEKNLGAIYCDMENLLKKSDFIVILTPLTKETVNLIDYKEFGIMKKNAVLINASRGQTVNEKALIEALQSRRIFGAGLDVFNQEPINSDNCLLKMKNVVTLPHIGSATEKTRTEMTMAAAKNLVIALTGEIPPGIISELNFIK